MSEGRTVVRGARVIDGSGGVHERATLVIEGERIAALVQAGEAAPEPAAGDTVLEASGRTVIPGLIGCHEHLTFMNTHGAYDQVVADDPDYLLLRCVKSGLVLLGQGVTTIREMGAKAGVNVTYRRAVERGMIVGPRTYTCRQSIIGTGGTGSQTSRVADGPDECRRAAREQIHLGANLVKVKASTTSPVRGGYAHVPQLTVEEMRAAFEEAHKSGKRAASHAVDAVSIRDSIEAGADSIEHGHQLDAATCELMARRGTYLVPTMTSHWQNAFNAEAWGRPTRGAASWQEHFESFRTALQAGVPIATGCDGVGNVHQEMELMVRGGMSCMEALRAATARAACLLDVDDRLGTIAPGRLADLVVLDADPLTDIRNTRTASTVISRGRVYPVSTIAAMTGEALA